MAWDYIIVGAGSAGCVLANRLSARPESKVLLLEAGGRDDSPYVRIPAGVVKALMSPRFNWQYQSEPDPSLNGRAGTWAGGKVLGGSSSINGMVYLRGQREDYDDWARLLGNTPEWSYPDVLGYFKRMETNPRGETEYHGGSGPLEVSDVPSPHPLQQIFITAATEVGIPFNADVNGEKQEGVGPNQGSVRFGRRNSSARAFLHPVMSRPNLEVRTEAKIDRVLFEGQRAVGVRFLHGGATREERCDGEVILATGTLASPVILMRSGIGPAAHLKAHGIEVVHDAPGVGQNLQDHLIVWTAGYVKIPTYNKEATPVGFVKHGLNWLLFGKGPAASPIAQAVAFVRTRPEQESRPDIQFHFIPSAYDMKPDGIHLLERAAVTITVNVCRPQSRNEIVLKSKDPNDGPMIKPNLMSDSDDMRRMIDGVKIAQSIYRAPTFLPYFDGPYLPGSGVESDAEIEAYVRAKVVNSWHAVGSCKMGIDEMAVVDPRLRVVGVAGLRVIDASIMPIIPSANTNAPTIMIGEKGSDLVLEDRADRGVDS